MSKIIGHQSQMLTEIHFTIQDILQDQCDLSNQFFLSYLIRSCQIQDSFFIVENIIVMTTKIVVEKALRVINIANINMVSFLF